MDWPQAWMASGTRCLQPMCTAFVLFLSPAAKLPDNFLKSELIKNSFYCYYKGSPAGGLNPYILQTKAQQAWGFKPGLFQDSHQSILCWATSRINHLNYKEVWSIISDWFSISSMPVDNFYIPHENTHHRTKVGAWDLCMSREASQLSPRSRCCTPLALTKLIMLSSDSVIWLSLLSVPLNSLSPPSLISLSQQDGATAVEVEATIASIHYFCTVSTRPGLLCYLKNRNSSMSPLLSNPGSQLFREAALEYF